MAPCSGSAHSRSATAASTTSTCRSTHRSCAPDAPPLPAGAMNHAGREWGRPLLLPRERDPEQPRRVPAEDLLQILVGHAHEAAGPDLLLEVADAVAAREPARIAPVDDPLRPDRLVELSEQVFQRQRVRHP